MLENRSVENVEYHEVRGLAGIKEATFTLGGKELKVAVANSTGAAKELIQRIKAGDASYAFVEVMACPGGCVPVPKVGSNVQVMYNSDKPSKARIL